MSNFFAWMREYRNDLILSVGFLLLLALAFGVGYLAGRDANPAPIVIERCAAE
jgi:hypothetical protein